MYDNVKEFAIIFIITLTGVLVFSFSLYLVLGGLDWIASDPIWNN